MATTAPAARKLPPGITEKRPGYWEVRVWYGFDVTKGKPYVMKRCVRGTLNDAKQLRRRVQDEVDGLMGAAPENANPTVAEFFVIVLDHLEKLNRSENTIKGYKDHMDTFANGISRLVRNPDGTYVPNPKFQGCDCERPTRCTCKWLREQIVPGFGNVKVKKLTPARIQAFYHALAGTGISGRTILSYHATLRRVLNFAIKQTLISHNAAERTERIPVVKRVFARPSDEAVADLIETAFAESWDVGIAFHLTAVLGGRRGEVIAERWRNRKGNLMLIDDAARQPGGGSTVTVDNSTKTHTERDVALDPYTVALLDEHRERMEKRAAKFGTELVEDAFILSDSPDGSEPWKPNRLTSATNRLSAKCSYESRFQDLRGWSHASAYTGDNLADIVRRGGWGNAQTFLTYYNNSSGLADEGIAAGIGDRLAAARTHKEAKAEATDELAIRRARRAAS